MLSRASIVGRAQKAWRSTTQPKKIDGERSFQGEGRKQTETCGEGRNSINHEWKKLKSHAGRGKKHRFLFGIGLITRIERWQRGRTDGKTGLRT